jgi:hypothetical protein
MMTMFLQAFENAACCEYYSGLYGQAALHFEQALVFRVTFAEDREIARLFIMVCCTKTMYRPHALDRFIELSYSYLRRLQFAVTS